MEDNNFLKNKDDNSTETRSLPDQFITEIVDKLMIENTLYNLEHECNHWLTILGECMELLKKYRENNLFDSLIQFGDESIDKSIKLLSRYLDDRQILNYIGLKDIWPEMIDNQMSRKDIDRFVALPVQIKSDYNAIYMQIVMFLNSVLNNDVARNDRNIQGMVIGLSKIFNLDLESLFKSNENKAQGRKSIMGNTRNSACVIFSINTDEK